MNVADPAGNVSNISGAIVETWIMAVFPIWQIERCRYLAHSTQTCRSDLGRLNVSLQLTGDLVRIAELIISV